MSQPWYPHYPSDELADTILLTCEEYGFFRRLRDYSWRHGGIPDSEESMERLRKAFQVSRYKLKKLWPAVENFFTLREGVFVYETDEKRRLEVVDISSKRKKAGSIGAGRRWSQRAHIEPQPGADPDSKPIANAIPQEMANAMYPEPEPEGIEDPPPPSELEHGGGGPHPPPDENTDGYHDFVARAAELGLPIPGQELVRAVRKKFHELSPAEAARRLPRFPGQTSPGLWVKKSRAELELETARQSEQRKPATREQHRDAMLQEADRIDRARAKGTGT